MAVQQLFVPNPPDGGAIKPCIAYASQLLTNYSDSLLRDGGDTNSSSTAVPGIGGYLVGWFLRERLSRQTPQFVGAGVWFFLMLATLALAMAGALNCYERCKRGQRPRRAAAMYSAKDGASTVATTLRPDSRASSANSLLSRSPVGRCLQDRRRRQVAKIALLIVLLIFATGVLAAFWGLVYGEGFGRIFQQKGSSGGGGGSLSLTVNSTVDKLNGFIEDTIVNTNTSILATCYEALPGILDLFNRIATAYLDLLSADFKLTPLLNTFDKFLGLVKLLLASMNSIKHSRDSVLSPLNSFTTVINRTREDLRSQVSEVCTSAPANGVPLELCNSVINQLNQLYIALDSRRIDSDSSVTIVTLLDKIFKLNITEVESQVNSAKAILTSSLSLIGDQIRSLFNSLIGTVSEKFAEALEGANTLRSDMVNATQSEVFVGAFRTADSVLQLLTTLIIVTYLLLLIAVAVVVGILGFFHYHWEMWRRAREQRVMGGEGPPASIVSGGENPQHPQPQELNPKALRSYQSIIEERQNRVVSNDRERECRHQERVAAVTERLRTRQVVWLMFGFGTWFALTFLFGFALLYAGAEIQLDACRYLAAPSATAVVDQMLDQIMDRDAWPFIQRLLASKISLPLPLTKAMLPKGLMETLLRRCSNSSATFFQIYNLVNAFNVSGLLQAKEVQTELYKGKDMVDKMVSGLNASTLIPPEVDSILNVLPDFAKLIDTQDFSTSIAELAKPLLAQGDRVPQLIGDLLAMVRILSDRSASDSRATLIRHFTANLNFTYLVDYPALNASLAAMRQQFVTLQTNRVVLNLTAELTVNLAQLKLGLANKTALLSYVAVRYDQVLTAYLPEMGQLLNSLLSLILGRVGYCNGIASALGVVVGECQGSLANMPSAGLLVAAASPLLVLLCCAAMLVMRTAGMDKRDAREQMEPTRGDSVPITDSAGQGDLLDGRTAFQPNLIKWPPPPRQLLTPPPLVDDAIELSVSSRSSEINHNSAYQYQNFRHHPRHSNGGNVNYAANVSPEAHFQQHSVNV